MYGFALIVLIAVIVYYCKAENVGSKKCYDSKRDFYPYFSTRTAYPYVRGNLSQLKPECQPLQIWMLSRHGARYPTADQIVQILSVEDIRDQILKNHEYGVGQLCATDLGKLRAWQLDPNLSKETTASLVSQGKKDLQMLAQRLRVSFPELLQRNDTNEYVFISTDNDRTRDSMKAFFSEFASYNEVSGTDDLHRNDSIILHGSCPAWTTSFHADDVYAERNKFTIGSEVQQVLENLSKRLGFSKILEFDTVGLIYEVCRFETAWNPHKLSVWCTLFTKDELIVLEYREDLDHYYCCGPGRQMNTKLSCPVVRDMFERFGQIENGKIDKQPKGVFYFGHTTNILSAMSVFHMTDDLFPLLASTFKTSNNRTFRASQIAPFSANLISVLYKCVDEDSQYKVTFHLNENLVQMNGCDNGMCDWKFLKRKYAPKVSHCDLNFCHDTVT